MRQGSLRLCSYVVFGAGLVTVLGFTGSKVAHKSVSHPDYKIAATSASVSAVDALRQKADTFTVAAAGQPSGEVSVLAHIAGPSGSLNTAQEREIAGLGGHIYRKLPIIDSVALRVPRRHLVALASLPFVSHLSSDVSVRKSDEFTVKSTGADVAYANYGLTGAGVGIAIVDSGIEKRPDLGGDLSTRIIASKDFVDPSNNKPVDECGHGTHIAGIIAGNGAKSSGDGFTHSFYGIARNANLINVRVLDGQGQGSVSDVISALDWIIKKKSAYNIRVVNLSMGHPVGESYTTDPLCQAVAKAWKAGIVVVTAAGNYGRQSNTTVDGNSNEGYGTNYGSIHSPGNSPYVITVGAMKPFSQVDASYDTTQHSYDKIATYSSRGPSVGDLVLKPDIVAPGNRIISIRPKDGFLVTSYPDNQIPKSWYVADANAKAQSKDYYILSGTSMAAPVVAGAAALLLEKDPGLTPDTVKARLMASASKWTNPDGTTDPFAYGAGYLNIGSALTSNLTVAGYALSPKLSVQSGGVLTVDASDASYVNGSLWGTGITDLRKVWGSSFRSATTFADPGNLWTTAYTLQGDIFGWGGTGDPKTTTSNGATVYWGVSGSIFGWGGTGTGNQPVTTTIFGWGGTGGGQQPVIGSIFGWGDVIPPHGP